MMVCRFDFSPYFELYPEEQRYQGYLKHTIDLEWGASSDGLLLLES